MDLHEKLRGTTRFLLAFMAAIAVFYGLLIYEAPYYIYRPGTAEAIRPMVSLERSAAPSTGAFMLTTVSMSHANWLNVTLANFDGNAELRRKQQVLRGQSEAEYEQRQDYVMLTSQSSAIQAAYEAAGVPYQIRPQGVIVLSVSAGLPAEGVLKPGDYVLQLNETPVKSTEDVLKFMAERKPGEKVAVAYQRKGIVHKAELGLQASPAAPDAGGGGSGAAQGRPRAVIGISPADVLAVKPDNPASEVKIQAGEIGGPSAGFMFALEIYSQLTGTDLTRGYRIAGTGTIQAQGNICSIGSIRQKVVAADRAGADIFFAPKDKYPPECNLLGPALNYSDAADQAKKIGTAMKVVPVDTLQEAIRYLRELPAKADKAA